MHGYVQRPVRLLHELWQDREDTAKYLARINANQFINRLFPA